VGDQPHYDIEARQAYDAVQPDGLPSSRELQGSTLLYHGSLGVREAISAESLGFLKREMSLPVMVDVNLRAPWWSLESASDLIRGADWVKVNREEAGALSGLPVKTGGELLDAMSALRSSLGLGTLVVTQGAEGVLASTGDRILEAQGPEVIDTVDTVGAGDAFSAVLCLGIHQGWPLETTLRRASEFAGDLCRVRGAIPTDRELYSRHQERWDHAL
jgi:fructokinase